MLLPIIYQMTRSQTKRKITSITKVDPTPTPRRVPNMPQMDPVPVVKFLSVNHPPLLLSNNPKAPPKDPIQIK